ncbi:hypothetical protein [Microvirga guangxiensis]|uniref:hypothetical protein n=1 Tax=Microvirga guangxiensis TaxID=549386 RepID=UPI000B80DC8A|nr:hypothetical protein [Microvirga guangxiensis]
MRRVEIIVPMLGDDIRYAIEIAETMEAANRIVPIGLEGREIKGASTYATIQNSLALKLALDVARIFDVSDNNIGLDRQDKASIPVLLHHLRKPEISAELIRRSRLWAPLPSYISLPAEDTCKAAVELALKRADELETTKAANALKRVRQFRTCRLAHMLFGKEIDAYPLYDDLFMLLRIAKSISTAAFLAVEGEITIFAENKRRSRDQGEWFWRRVLDGLLITETAS